MRARLSPRSTVKAVRGLSAGSIRQLHVGRGPCRDRGATTGIHYSIAYRNRQDRAGVFGLQTAEHPSVGQPKLCYQFIGQIIGLASSLAALPILSRYLGVAGF